MIPSLVPPGAGEADGPVELVVCVNDGTTQNKLAISCSRRGSLEVERALTEACARRGGRIAVRTARCLGMCGRGPNVRLRPGRSRFHGVTVADVEALLDLVEAHCAAQLAAGVEKNPGAS